MDPYVVTALLAERTVLWETTLEVEAPGISEARIEGLNLLINCILDGVSTVAVCEELERSLNFLLDY